MRPIKFYFDFLSPYSYMALTQLPGLASRLNREVQFKPINVLELMERVGNQPTTVLCDAKLNYAIEDLSRWAKSYAVPFAPNPHLGSIDSQPLLLGALAAGEHGVVHEYTNAVFNAYWVEQSALANTAELLRVLQNAGVPSAETIVESQASYSMQLKHNMSDAVDEGVFGVPSFVTDAGLFFGNDRLSFLEAALRA